MKFEIISHDSIKKLMDVFYAKVMIDKDFGHIFNEKIGTDDESWKKHKEKNSKFLSWNVFV